MTILSTVLLVFFVIIALLLILMVLIQTEEGDSLGGIFAGGSGSAFGSRSGNVLTRTTTVLGALFLIISLGLAMLNRSRGDRNVITAAQEDSSGEVGTLWWDEQEESGFTFNLDDFLDTMVNETETETENEIETEAAE